MQGRELTHVDLFSGIGGFSLAAGWAGFRTVAFCEKDEWCRSILQSHWPDVPISHDVRDFPGRDYRGATLLTGGFPASRFPSAGSAEAHKTIAISGLRCLRQSSPSDRLGSYVKMLLESSRWHSRLSLLTWKVRDFNVPCCCYQLTESVRHTGDAGLSLLPNHSIPTPTASDYIERKCTRKDKAAALNFDTNKSVSLDRWFRNRYGKPLTPEFSEWIMGFPIGWTRMSGAGESKPSATQSSPNSSTSC